MQASDGFGNRAIAPRIEFQLWNPQYIMGIAPVKQYVYTLLEIYE